MTSLPLANKRILVTRAAHQAGKLSEGLRAAGARARRSPRPRNPAARKLTIRSITLCSISTATTGSSSPAPIPFAQLPNVPPPSSISLRDPGPHIAAIGQATAEAARNAGLHVTLTPESYVAESLVDHAGHSHSRKTRSARPRRHRSRRHPRRAAQSRRHRQRRRCLPERDPSRCTGQLRAALASGIDAATFTSSSSVTHLAEVARAARHQPFPFAGVQSHLHRPRHQRHSPRTRLGTRRRSHSPRHPRPHLAVISVIGA